MTVHNHRPYYPPCNERIVDGRRRGACLTDDGLPRSARHEPERPILCAHHQQLLDAVDANSTGVDLDSLAATFARGCDHCQEA